MTTGFGRLSEIVAKTCCNNFSLGLGPRPRAQLRTRRGRQRGMALQRSAILPLSESVSYGRRQTRVPPLSARTCRAIRTLFMPDTAWSLHSRLKEDTIDIGDLPLSKVLVIKDAHYPWLLLVPRRADAVEIIDLDEVQQAQLMTEITRVSRALKEITKCDKLNVAALGNLVPQLHVHIIARRTSDAAWPRPVWGVMPPLPHDAEEVQNFISALRRKIWLG
jgi:diadenosine tetraphosphate (Ap4A) HIT family hydrolase